MAAHSTAYQGYVKRLFLQRLDTKATGRSYRSLSFGTRYIVSKQLGESKACPYLFQPYRDGNTRRTRHAPGTLSSSQWKACLKAPIHHIGPHCMGRIHATRHDLGIPPCQQHWQGDPLPVTHFGINTVDCTDSGQINPMVNRFDSPSTRQQQLLSLAVRVDGNIACAKVCDREGVA